MIYSLTKCVSVAALNTNVFPGIAIAHGHNSADLRSRERRRATAEHLWCAQFRVAGVRRPGVHFFFFYFFSRFKKPQVLLLALVGERTGWSESILSC